MADGVWSRQWDSWQVFKLVWGSLRTALTKMPTLTVGSAVLYALFGAGALWARLHLPDARSFQQLGSVYQTGVLTGIAAIQYVAGTMVIAPVAVAIHRLILVEEVSPLRAAVARRVGLFVLWMLALQLTFELLLHLADHGSLVRLFLSCLAIFVSVRLAPIFPAVAIDAEPKDVVGRVRQAWSTTRGYFLTLMALYVFCILPLLILMMAPTIALSILKARVHEDVYSQPLPMMLDVKHWGQVFVQFLAPFWIAITAGVASWMYKWSNENGPDRGASADVAETA